MYFENIFPFILIILYVAWYLFARNRQKKVEVEKPQVATDEAQVSIRLGDVLKQMFFSSADERRPFEEQNIKDERPALYSGQTTVTIETPTVIAPLAEKIIATGAAQPFKNTARLQPEKSIRKQSAQMTDLSQKDLQQAIIWAEILAPPVGLREA